MFKRLLSAPVDWVTLLVPIVLTATGIITIYTITFAQDKAGLATDQIVFAVIGLIVMVVTMFSDYRWFRSVTNLMYFVTLILLVMLVPVLADQIPFTLKVFGAYRWLDFQFFQLQPGEVFKIVAALFGAKILASHIGRMNWRKTITYLLIALVPVFLILMQPDLGTASVVAVIFAGIFLSARPPGRIIFVLIMALIISTPLIWANLKPYQKDRVETLLNPSVDPQGQGYNVRQALIAVGSGGLTGRGFGQGSQTVLNFLPVAHTDFVFAGFAEATGFIGSAVVLLLYILLIYRSLAIASISTDRFGQLLAVAIAVKFLFQITVHIGMNLGLLPVTGIPLPFMSYGGTSLITDLFAIGLLESIHIRHSRLGFHR